MFYACACTCDMHAWGARARCDGRARSTLRVSSGSLPASDNFVGVCLLVKEELSKHQFTLFLAIKISSEVSTLFDRASGK